MLESRAAKKLTSRNTLRIPPIQAGLLLEWSGSRFYGELAPSTAQDVERQLFANDLEILLLLLRREYGHE